MDTKLDWTAAAKEGHVVVDYPARKLAVFANTSGQVAIVAEDEGVQSVLCLEFDEALKAISAFAKAARIAADRTAEMFAEYEAAKTRGEAE